MEEDTLLGTETADTADSQEQVESPTSQEQKADAGQPTQSQTEEQKPAQEQVPEKYEFKPVEGNEVAPEVLEHFSGVAKELGLSQDKAQLVLDRMAPMLHARQQEQIAQVHQDWANQSKADKEFGGEYLQENLSYAKRAIDAFGTPEFKELLNASGIGNHPEVIRFCVRAGRRLAEDKMVQGGTSTNQAKRIAFYDNSQMN
ncbi:hypothetical protein [Basilea psittacipulmonis]|uniref:hypothetical protein n=1 Tax=Basilea psittacipulmonis TaxID=1472345 RepID=UPI00068BEB3A|nr:hypothetical protein [Basilea psittacipulmonis]